MILMVGLYLRRLYVLVTCAANTKQGDNEGNDFLSLSYVENHGCFVDTKEVTPNITKGVHGTRLTVTRPAAGRGLLTDMAIGLALFGTANEDKQFPYAQVIDREHITLVPSNAGSPPNDNNPNNVSTCAN